MRTPTTIHSLLLAAALAAGGCETGACRGVDGTCVALTVTGAGAVDGLKIALSGAAAGTRVAPAHAEIQALPVEVAVQLTSAHSGPLHLEVTGVYLGGVVGVGAAEVDVQEGGHSAVTVALSSDGSVPDGGVPLDDMARPPDMAPFVSCKAILLADPSAPTGWYTITPPATGSPVEVLCDMDSAGGGWTACAWSVSPAAATADWAPKATAQSSNWYACHKLIAGPVEAMARLSSSSVYVNQYSAVNFASTANAMLTPSVAKAPNFTLILTPNGAACNQTSNGNYQWGLSTAQTILGLNPMNTCGSGGASIFVGGTGVHTNGCWGTNQISPQVGYPCGGYGNYGVHLELYAR